MIMLFRTRTRLTVICGALLFISSASGSHAKYSKKATKNPKNSLTPKKSKGSKKSAAPTIKRENKNDPFRTESPTIDSIHGTSAPNFLSKSSQPSNNQAQILSLSPTLYPSRRPSLVPSAIPNAPAYERSASPSSSFTVSNTITNTPNVAGSLKPSHRPSFTSKNGRSRVPTLMPSSVTSSSPPTIVNMETTEPSYIPSQSPRPTKISTQIPSSTQPTNPHDDSSDPSFALSSPPTSNISSISPIPSYTRTKHPTMTPRMAPSSLQPSKPRLDSIGPSSESTYSTTLQTSLVPTHTMSDSMEPSFAPSYSLTSTMPMSPIPSLVAQRAPPTIMPMVVSSSPQPSKPRPDSVKPSLISSHFPTNFLTGTQTRYPTKAPSSRSYLDSQLPSYFSSSDTPSSTSHIHSRFPTATISSVPSFSHSSSPTQYMTKSPTISSDIYTYAISALVISLSFPIYESKNQPQLRFLHNLYESDDLLNFIQAYCDEAFRTRWESVDSLYVFLDPLDSIQTTTELTTRQTLYGTVSFRRKDGTSMIQNDEIDKYLLSTLEHPNFLQLLRDTEISSLEKITIEPFERGVKIKEPKPTEPSNPPPIEPEDRKHGMTRNQSHILFVVLAGSAVFLLSYHYMSGQRNRTLMQAMPSSFSMAPERNESDPDFVCFDETSSREVSIASDEFTRSEGTSHENSTDMQSGLSAFEDIRLGNVLEIDEMSEIDPNSNIVNSRSFKTLWKGQF